MFEIPGKCLNKSDIVTKFFCRTVRIIRVILKTDNCHLSLRISLTKFSIKFLNQLLCNIIFTEFFAFFANIYSLDLSAYVLDAPEQIGGILDEIRTA